MAKERKGTMVRSIRASADFWAKAKEISIIENTDINKLIVKIVSDYFKEVENGKNP